jgi:Tfp pilus assembly protein PilN
MPQLHLDYQRSSRPFPRAGVALLVLALLTLPVIGLYYSRLTERLSGWEDSLEQMERNSKRLQRQAQPPSGDIAQEWGLVQGVTRQTTLPWEELFRAIERAVDKNVALLGVAPDPARQEVKIHGEARDYSAMLAFIRHLEQQPEFGSVYLQSHQLELDDPEKPMSFALLAKWRAQR